MSRIYFFRFSTKTVSGWPIVRDLTAFDGEHIIFAESSNIQITNRQFETALCLPETVAGGSKSAVTFSIPTHRREITCLDFDKEKKIVVTGGRDRMLSRLNFENLFAGGPSPEKPITQMNAHERLITSVKIHKIDDMSYVFSSSRYERLLTFNLGTFRCSMYVR